MTLKLNLAARETTAVVTGRPAFNAMGPLVLGDIGPHLLLADDG